MYLKCTNNKKTGRKYLSCVYGYRDGDGKCHTKIYESYGYIDELAKKYKDPEKHFRKVVESLNHNPTALGHVHDEISALQHPASTPRVETKNLGYLVPLYYYQRLGINGFWQRVQRKHKLMFDLNAIFRMFVLMRILEPDFSEQTPYNTGLFFERHDFSDQDVYRALHLFAEYQDRFNDFLQTRLSRYRRERVSDPNSGQVSPADPSTQAPDRVDETFSDVFHAQLNLNQSTKASEAHQSRLRSGCQRPLWIRLRFDKDGYPRGYSYGVQEPLGDGQDTFLRTVNSEQLAPDQLQWAADNDWQNESAELKAKARAEGSGQQLVCFWSLENCRVHNSLKHHQHYYGASRLCDGLTTFEVDHPYPDLLRLSRVYSRMLWARKVFSHVKPLLYYMPDQYSQDDVLSSHFVCCETAWALMALIEEELSYAYDGKRVSHELLRFTCLHTKENRWQISYWNPVLSELCRSVGVHFHSEELTQMQIKQILAKVKHD
ncbi:MAG: hypothetical protein LBL67_00530 [Coriobacteriales bacterium]|jgi:hypothetical protein|nr:hypothetical protein [Coriobacteriales bacterium]